MSLCLITFQITIATFLVWYPLPFIQFYGSFHFYLPLYPSSLYLCTLPLDLVHVHSSPCQNSLLVLAKILTYRHPIIPSFSQLVICDSVALQLNPAERRFSHLCALLTPSSYVSQSTYQMLLLTVLMFEDWDSRVLSFTPSPHQIVHCLRTRLMFHNFQNLLHLAQSYIKLEPDKK